MLLQDFELWDMDGSLADISFWELLWRDFFLNHDFLDWFLYLFVIAVFDFFCCLHIGWLWRDGHVGRSLDFVGVGRLFVLVNLGWVHVEPDVDNGRIDWFPVLGWVGVDGLNLVVVEILAVVKAIFDFWTFGFLEDGVWVFDYKSVLFCGLVE